MPDPKFEFDKEEFTLTITGLGGGWRFRDLSTIRLFDAQWHMHANTLLTQTLGAGIDYTRADGTGGSMSSDTSLVQHILDRPTLQLDLRLNVRLDGTATRQGFEGSATAGLFLGGK